MTTFNAFTDRNRDLQDHNERHIYSEIEDVDGGGRIIKAKGTGTQDEEMFVMAPFGLGGRYPKDTNAEVHSISNGSDTQLKFAFVDTPHDKQRKWEEGTNGMQKWDNPDIAVEFNKKRTHGTDKNWAIGPNGEFELKNGIIYFRVPVHIEKLHSPPPVPPVIPPFEK
jgi:hypothetical protein